ncbi:hypothetical protein KDW36_08850 [Burkholderia dolosa]|uniref:hypothetical protein n=1 Tax=Burkholderia dolosa TaxID=152500 RepID=UPI001B9B5399|nr:hypothetical protein [Burkholderia dolosa]MBR8313307.1 hypothetical protein [Burkholderia dolosa]
MNDLFIVYSLGSHVLDHATAHAAASEHASGLVFARVATLRYSLRAAKQNRRAPLERLPARSSGRSNAARADAARRATQIAGYRIVDVEVIRNAARRRMSQRANVRASGVAPALERPRMSMGRRRVDADGRRPSGIRTARLFHSGGG